MAKAKSKKAMQKIGEFCVYIGPTIRGVVQNGTIYPYARDKVLEMLAPQIEKYPLIAKLVVPSQTFAADRLKVKEKGTLLNTYYQRLTTTK